MAGNMGMTPGVASYLFAQISVGSYIGWILAVTSSWYLGQLNVITSECYISAQGQTSMLVTGFAVFAGAPIMGTLINTYTCYTEGIHFTFATYAYAKQRVAT
ncbi:hypothetical protein F4779DRAFT_624054 [Xylariaceae sp. FL0662B]|nr:hypothetical protein F4779DRAFT_624054 [Xylariaceae sp. FL0662B]